MTEAIFIPNLSFFQQSPCSFKKLTLKDRKSVCKSAAFSKGKDLSAHSIVCPLILLYITAPGQPSKAATVAATVDHSNPTGPYFWFAQHHPTSQLHTQLLPSFLFPATATTQPTQVTSLFFSICSSCVFFLLSGGADWLA